MFCFSFEYVFHVEFGDGQFTISKSGEVRQTGMIARKKSD